MKTLLNVADHQEILHRLANLGADARGRWGVMSAHQMICHLSDSLRAFLGEKYVGPSSSFFTRKILKPVALWGPFPWPHGYKTLPELDQMASGTAPAVFAADLKELRVLLEQFCTLQEEFVPHPIFGPLSKRERMRHAYLHFDHHLRQFGA